MYDHGSIFNKRKYLDNNIFCSKRKYLVSINKFVNFFAIFIFYKLENKSTVIPDNKNSLFFFQFLMSVPVITIWETLLASFYLVSILNNLVFAIFKVRLAFTGILYQIKRGRQRDFTKT